MSLNNLDGVKIGNLVSDEEVEEAKKDKRNIVLNMNNKAENIVDKDEMTKKIAIFLEYITSDVMEKFEDTDNNAFKEHVMNKFESYFDDYFSVFSMLLEKKNRQENIKKLLNMLTTLDKIKKNNGNIKKEFEKFQEQKAAEYIYPKFGGKEQFEKTMKKQLKKK